ncbi:MAG TPA: type 1 glutamine amidotransferase domain-containing protein [Xanthomonadaceae bacterium]|nr:type 1 glutamine amidotransferase domain-containing protein [Xanthomonadaceae bacterium]
MAAVLMLVTSADRMPDGQPTGLWLEEFATPWQVLRAGGHAVTAASPRGGAAPVDPRSREDAREHPQWAEAERVLRTTAPLAGQRAADYDALFIAGGHGTMFDFPDNPALGALLRDFHAQGKPVAAVCHGPAAFVGATAADGRPLVAGRTLTAFSDDEERAVKLEHAVPFLLSERLGALGAQVENGPAFAPNVRRDGWLITGQNPMSSAGAADLLVEALRG